MESTEYVYTDDGRIKVNVFFSARGEDKSTVVSRTEAAGLRVAKVLDKLDIILGDIDEAPVADQLRAVPGVDYVFFDQRRSLDD